MKQEGIRFGSPLIEQQWGNMVKLETAINYLDVMLTTASQQSLGTKGEVKHLQVYMRGNELLCVTLNSQKGGTIAISDYAKGVDPILLNMLLMTVDTYIKNSYKAFLKDAFEIDLVKELNIEEVEEEVKVETPEPVTSQDDEYNQIDKAMAVVYVNSILSNAVYFDTAINGVPMRVKPLVLDILVKYNIISQDIWEKEVKKLEHKSTVEKVVEGMTKRWNETTKQKGEEN